MSVVAFCSGSSFAVLVGQAAGVLSAEPRVLAARALLHLPCSRNGWLTKSQVQRELAIQAMTVKARLYLYENRRSVSSRQLRERHAQRI
jgi:hypothetical protein